MTINFTTLIMLIEIFYAYIQNAHKGQLTQLNLSSISFTV